MWNVVLLLGAIGAGIWASLRNRTPVVEPRPNDDRLRGWQDAAQRCGLQVVDSTSRVYPQLTARSGPVQVRIETFGSQGQATRIVAGFPMAPDFQGVQAGPRSSSSVRQAEIRNLGFDSTFTIEGPILPLFALLDSDTRLLLRALNDAGGLAISPGQIRAVVSRDEQVSEALPFILEICKRLGTPVEIPRKLVENVKRDSDGGARLQNLLFLLSEFPGDPGTAEALRVACSDPSPVVRLRAARELGAEGRDVLLEIAQSLDDDAVSAEALSILDRDVPLEHATAILDRARSTGRLQTALACVKALGRPGAAAAALLTEVLALQNAELAAAAARALGAIGSPNAEPSLIQALEHHDANVRLAAVDALRRVGTAAAVLPLKETAERFRLHLELRGAAQRAIAVIQSRAQGASPGQLSLAGAEAGQLSLAEDPAGRLSLPGERPE